MRSFRSPLRPGLCRLAVLLVLLGGVAAAPGAFAQSAAEYNAAGISAYDGGVWGEAIGLFEKAYELAPDNKVVRRNLCNAHQAQANELAKVADYRAAAEHLEIAIAIDPRNAGPLIQLGSYYLRLDMVDDAIYRLEEAIEISPGDIDAHSLLGEAYYKDNDIASALVQWEWVLQADPSRAGLRERYDKAMREAAVEEGHRQGSSRHFRISYPRETPTEMQRRVLTHLERARLEVGQNLGGVYPPGTVQVIAYTAKGFSEATLLEGHVGAVYDGKIRVPLTDPMGNYLDDEDLRRRLFHEYTHVVVRFIANDNVPWWLNEGLAETFSRGDLPERHQRVLSTAYADGLTFDLKSLEASQLRRLSPENLSLAYLQSHATVHTLWTRFGKHRMAQLMGDLAEGLRVEESLRTRYRRNYRTLESEVARTYAVK